MNRHAEMKTLLKLTKEDCRQLERLLEDPELEDSNTDRLMGRAMIVLMAAKESACMDYIARKIGSNRHTVSYWLQKFREGGVARLAKDAPRSGRPRKVTGSKLEEIKAAILVNEKLKTGRLSTRDLADKFRKLHVDVSHMTIWRLSKIRRSKA